MCPNHHRSVTADDHVESVLERPEARDEAIEYLTVAPANN